jgi:vacuolar-type H+-ATPase subunit H
MGKEEVLKRIRDAESQVQAMISQAERERDASMAQARREADRIVEQGFSEVDAALDRAFHDAREATACTSAARMEEGLEAIASDRLAAESRLPGAVDALLAEFEQAVLKG